MDNDNIKKLNNRASLIVLCSLATLMLLAELGATALWGSENRWAEIARNMLLTGDWFHPVLNGKIYFDKPLLSYWLICLPADLIGILNEFMVRLPSALAGLAALWGTFLLADQLWDRRTAIISSWLLLTCYGFVFWSRKGAADVEDLAAIILAVAWYFNYRDKAGFWFYLLFGLICVLGAHTKGLPAICVPLVVILPDLVRHNNWKKHLKWQIFAAAAVCVIVYLLPFVISSLTSAPSGYVYPDIRMPAWAEPYHKQLFGLYLVWKENVLRAFETFDHKEPFYAYFIHVPRIMLPWSPLFLVALAAFVANWKKLEEKNRWLLEAVALIFLMFSLSGSKRWYYILPIMPFCAILTAVFISGDLWKKAQTWIWHIYKYVSVIAGVLLVMAIPAQFAAAMLFRKAAESPHKLMKKIALLNGVCFPLPWLISLTVLGIIILGLWYYYAVKPKAFDRMLGSGLRHWSPLLLSFWVLIFGAFCIAPSMVEPFRTERSFSRDLKQYIHASGITPDDIAFYNRDSNTMLFYIALKRPVAVIHNSKELKVFLKRPGTNKLIISQYRYVDGLKRDASSPLPSPIFKEYIFPWEKPWKKIFVYKISKQGGE